MAALYRQSQIVNLFFSSYDMKIYIASLSVLDLYLFSHTCDQEQFFFLFFLFKCTRVVLKHSISPLRITVMKITLPHAASAVRSDPN